MLSRAETEFLRGEKQAKPNQRRYLRHCVKKKIEAFGRNDLPAIMANEWAKGLFQSVIGNNNGCVMESNNALDIWAPNVGVSAGSGLRSRDLQIMSLAPWPSF